MILRTVRNWKGLVRAIEESKEDLEIYGYMYDNDKLTAITLRPIRGTHKN